MTKEDGSDNSNGSGETATWTGQGIVHYSGQRRKDPSDRYFAVLLLM